MITIVGMLTTLGTNYAITNERLTEIKKNNARLEIDIKENREKILFLDSQSVAKSEIDRYQNAEHEKIYGEIDRVKDVIYKPSASAVNF